VVQCKGRLIAMYANMAIVSNVILMGKRVSNGFWAPYLAPKNKAPSGLSQSTTFHSSLQVADEVQSPMAFEDSLAL
jgi:hypothetical protein